MKLNRRSLIKGIGAAGVTLSFAGLVSANEQGNTRFIVTGRRGVTNQLNRAGYEIQHTLAGGMVHLVEGPADGNLSRIPGVREYARDIKLSFEEPERKVQFDDEQVEQLLPPIDERLFPWQWDKDVTNVPDANEVATGAGSTIAVLDTGVGITHPNLVENVNVADGRRFRFYELGEHLDEAGPAVDRIQGGSGLVEVPVDHDDEELGTQLVDEQPLVNDVQGHGTNVSGIAAAKPIGPTISPFSITGTAPDAEIVPLRVFYWIEADDEDDDGEVIEDVATLITTTGDILLAIDYAARIGADVANLSLGTAPLPPQVNALGIRVAYEQVIQHAVRQGTVIVASAGNAAANLQQGGFFSIPNSVAGAMSISATGPNDLLAFYSNFGTNEIDVGAPGGGYETLAKTLEEEFSEVDWPFPFNLVLNTFVVDSTGDSILNAPSYAWFAGTSMAAPQVAGAAALVREMQPNANARQVEKAIKQGADLARGRNDPHLGAGRLNALNTVQEAEGGNPTRGRGRQN